MESHQDGQARRGFRRSCWYRCVQGPFLFFFQIELWVLLVTGLNVLGFHYINETDSKFIFFNGLIQSSRLEQTG